MNTTKTALALILLAVPLGGAAAREEPITPIVPAVVTDQALVELGKKLYFDPRLSKSGFISCNSCHNLSMGGSDNLPTSIGHNWQQGPDQRADRAELEPERRPVLGRPRRRRCRSRPVARSRTPVKWRSRTSSRSA